MAMKKISLIKSMYFFDAGRMCRVRDPSKNDYYHLMFFTIIY